nr:acyl-CoA thioesterase [uncultured Sellimonas sp.]
MNDIKSKRVEDSMVETVRLVRPTHLNSAGRLFGGVLMQWIDEAAGIVAKRHCMSNITTASVDNLRFIRGAYQNDMVVIRAKMTYTGRTSMEIRVDTYVEDSTGMRRPINRAYFTVVALDENDRPKEVPRLVVESETEKAEWEGALKRRENRMMRKEEGF